jgi:predicted component of type VI protein secretion system
MISLPTGRLEMNREDDTIISDSPLGKRLKNMKKSEGFQLFYNGQYLPITKEITIGRSRDNDIVLDDGMTSRHHALIQKIRDDFYVKDMGSSNGTFVNEERVPKGKYLKINRGDKIQIGRTYFKIT